MLKKAEIKITGISCKSCKMLIEDEIDVLRGVKEVTVDFRNGKCEIEFDENKVSKRKIIKKIEELGYGVSGRPSSAKSFFSKNLLKEWLFAGGILLGIFLLYRILNNFGLLQWLDTDQSKMNYGVAFLAGIVASASTCLMVVGAVVISFSAKYETNERSFYSKNVKPHLLFHFGRLATFFVLGGVLGLVGSWFSFSGGFVGWFTILVALVLVWLGLNILGALPAISSLGISLPKKFLKNWNKLKNSEHPLAPAVLGGLTFFLPCGFTQSMQLFAMSTGVPWQGSWTLFFFALGTGPVLLGLGVAANRFKNLRLNVFKKAAGMAIIIFSIYIFSSGLAILGVSGVETFVSQGEQKKQAVASKEEGKNDEIQVIKMTVDYRGFKPNVFTLEKGVPVKWVIEGEQVSGCTNEIIVPSLKVKQEIKPGKNIVEFTPNKTGTINFSCWMGMVRGKFIVKENDTAVENQTGHKLVVSDR